MSSSGKSHIQEQLSKIKAINEEKSEVEKMLLVLHSWQPPYIDEVTIGNMLQQNSRSFHVSGSTGNDVRCVLINYYERRKNELIAKAEELINGHG